MSGTALITGASSGIGAALARQFAARGFDLVLTARRESRLERLAEELVAQYGRQVDIVGADLASSGGVRAVLRAVETIGRPIEVLINNAGAAATGAFSETDTEAATDIVNVNVRALTELTSGLLPGMIERASGRILNVASVVSFAAVPGMATYSASKAYVLAFSEALSEELKDTGVTVTALCPGLTQTEMVGSLDANGVPPFAMASAESVARAGYDACMQGRPIEVPGVMNQAFVSWLEANPRWFLRNLSGAAARFAAPFRRMAGN